MYDPWGIQREDEDRAAQRRRDDDDRRAQVTADMSYIYGAGTNVQDDVDPSVGDRPGESVFGRWGNVLRGW